MARHAARGGSFFPGLRPLTSGPKKATPIPFLETCQPTPKGFKPGAAIYTSSGKAGSTDHPLR